jgi:hypothetical protein
MPWPLSRLTSLGARQTGRLEHDIRAARSCFGAPDEHPRGT